MLKIKPTPQKEAPKHYLHLDPLAVLWELSLEPLKAFTELLLDASIF